MVFIHKLSEVIDHLEFLKRGQTILVLSLKLCLVWFPPFLSYLFISCPVGFRRLGLLRRGWSSIFNPIPSIFLRPYFKVPLLPEISSIEEQTKSTFRTLQKEKVTVVRGHVFGKADEDCVCGNERISCLVYYSRPEGGGSLIKC